MNIADTMDAIVTRATGDTGSGGLFNTTTPLLNAFYANRTPPETDFPYGIATLVGADSRAAFEKSIWETRVRITWYVERDGHTIADPLLRSSQIAERIRGNWSSASPGTAPTYGFDRHPLVISGWGSPVMFLESIFDESDEYIQHVYQFRFFPSA